MCQKHRDKRRETKDHSCDLRGSQPCLKDRSSWKFRVEAFFSFHVFERSDVSENLFRGRDIKAEDNLVP